MVFSILDTLDQYNVIWDSPSRNAAGSMPLGNGQIGVNVWAEPDGDVLFYVSATDAWDDNGRLLKLGRLAGRADAKSFHGKQSIPADA